ncbi:MAG: type II/IV secretion system ATPase subunit [Candidatus Aenigmatarchaeota archaeon]|nr:type II/IV secretion system ATPase subunit [Candidatus Aenigmarchaeota archaeon]
MVVKMVLQKKKKGKFRLGRVIRKAVAGYRVLKTVEERKRRARMPPITIERVEAEAAEVEAKGAAIEAAAAPAGVPVTGAPIYTLPRKPPEVDLTTINITYPLIPAIPPPGTRPFAEANIRWSAPDAALIYYLIEPELSAQEKALLEEIKTALVEKLDIDFTMLRKVEAKEYLHKRFDEMLKLMAADLPEERRAVMLYYIERDFIGLGKIEPLMQDPDIEDISVDGVGIPAYVYHRNPLIGSIRTNVIFDSPDELDTFVHKLAQRCGKSISVAMPLLGAALPDGSRVQATLATDIARRGSNFTIRKFTEMPLTPTHMLRFKTLDSKMAAYLWLAIEYGRSVLISGGVATGKTSLLNALSLFIKPELKIVSIEDTPELKLPQPNWIAQVARQPIAEVEGRKVGEVDLFDLLRESLRQRPDYLIVGEVRGKEAFVLFQQIATGHASMSTIHADTMERLIDRLTTAPISLPGALLEALDIIVFVVRIKYGPAYVRRVSNIYEIIGFDRTKNMPLTNEVFRWNPKTDKYEAVNPSIVLKKIASQYGIHEAILQREISQRMKVLEWMSDVNMTDYRDIARVIKLYYTRPEDVLAAI